MLQGQRYWPGFCRAAGRPELADDPRFDTDAHRQANISECVAAIDDMFATRTLKEWQEILATQPGQWDTVQNPGDVHLDHQVIANQFMQEVDYEDGRKLKMVSVPVLFDRQALKARPAPEFSAHSDSILADLGYSEDEIIDLKVAGVVY
jgi:crotonobetainyl-CoA:carnitine CoA-transferase CaiB-like acyl-CoA transferase